MEGRQPPMTSWGEKSETDGGGGANGWGRGGGSTESQRERKRNGYNKSKQTYINLKRIQRESDPLNIYRSRCLVVRSRYCY